MGKTSIKLKQVAPLSCTHVWRSRVNCLISSKLSATGPGSVDVGKCWSKKGPNFGRLNTSVWSRSPEASSMLCGTRVGQESVTARRWRGLAGSAVPNARLHPASSRAVSVVLSLVEVRNVLRLLLQRQLVELLSDRELPVHSLLRNSLPPLRTTPNRQPTLSTPRSSQLSKPATTHLDVEESLGADGADELLGEGLLGGGVVEV